MPDRIIAATALLLRVPLITRDQRIQSAGIQDNLVMDRLVLRGTGLQPVRCACCEESKATG